MKSSVQVDHRNNFQYGHLQRFSLYIIAYHAHVTAALPWIMMHSGAFIPNQQQHLHGISWSTCFAILLPESWSLPELVEVNILKPTESICSTNPSLKKNILRSHAAYPSSPSMESLRVPGTMVMDSTNAGTRAPIMSRLEDFFGGSSLWCFKLNVQTESPGVAPLGV